jgi:hypothetical protein
MREMRENGENELKLWVPAIYTNSRLDGLVSRSDTPNVECLKILKEVSRLQPLWTRMGPCPDT